MTDPLILELQQRVTALEARPPAGSEALTPTYLTATPQGQIGANFTGVVNALGLYIAESISGVLRQTNAAIWTRPDQNGMDMTTNPPPLFLAVQEASIGRQTGGAGSAAGELAQLTTQAVNSPQKQSLIALLQLIANGALFSGGGTAQQSRVDIQADNATATNDSFVRVRASQQSATVLDGTGASSFLQLLSTQKRQRWPQQQSAINVPGNGNTNLTFSNPSWDLGNTMPFFQCYVELLNTAWMDHCSWARTASTATSVTISVANNQANAASGTVLFTIETSTAL